MRHLVTLGAIAAAIAMTLPGCADGIDDPTDVDNYEVRRPTYDAGDPGLEDVPPIDTEPDVDAVVIDPVVPVEQTDTQTSPDQSPGGATQDQPTTPSPSGENAEQPTTSGPQDAPQSDTSESEEATDPAAADDIEEEPAQQLPNQE